MPKLPLSMFLTMGISCLPVTASLADGVSNVTIHNDLEVYLYVGKQGSAATQIKPNESATIELIDSMQQLICAVKQEVDCINSEQAEINSIKIGTIERGAEEPGRGGSGSSKPTPVTTVRLQPLNYKLGMPQGTRFELVETIDFGLDKAGQRNQLSTSYAGKIDQKDVYNMTINKRSESDAICEYKQYPDSLEAFCFKQVDSAVIHIFAQPVMAQMRRDEL